MGEEYYAVYCDETKLADHMTLGTALLFIKAYVQEYWRGNYVMSLKKVSAETDRYERDLRILQKCNRQSEFEVDEKGYEE